MALVYKLCGNYILTLQKLEDTITNEDRIDIFDIEHAMHYADKLLVIHIENKSINESLDSIKYHNKIYKVGTVTDAYYVLNKEQLLDVNMRWHVNGALYQQKNNDSITSWHDNGEICHEIPIKNGKLHGTFTSYYSDGDIWAEGRFINGVRVYDNFHTSNITPLTVYPWKFT